jgi:predicted PurR-regulated permease PerM
LFYLIFIIPPIAEQTSKFVNNLPSIVEDASKQYSGLQEFADTHNLQEYIDQSVESIKSYSSEVTKNIGSVIFGSVYAVANGIFTLFMVLMMTFFILVEGPEWLNKIWSLYSDKEKMKKHRRISNRMYKAVSAFVNGQLTVCAISGTCGALVVFILGLTLGVPTGLILPVGVILFLFGLIPMFGATIAGVLSAIIIGLNIPAAGIVFAIYFIIYQQIENNIISPMIQAKTNKLSALLVIVSITIGIYAFGLHICNYSDLVQMQVPPIYVCRISFCL